MSWNEEQDKILLEHPGYWDITVGRSKLPKTGEFHCDCGVACVTNVEMCEDRPPENEEIKAICWSCGKEFVIHWRLEPVWHEGGVY